MFICKMPTKKYTVVWFSIVCLWFIMGCNSLQRLAQATVTPTAVIERETVDTIASPTPEPIPPTPTVPPTATVQPELTGRYQLDFLTESTRSSFNGFPLRIHHAEFMEDGVEFEVGFENHNDVTTIFRQTIEPDDFVIEDVTGQRFVADSLSGNLSTITLSDGLIPGMANVGFVRFPAFIGTPPYTFLVAESYGYEALVFEYGDFQQIVSQPMLADGVYSIDITLFSPAELLATIDLQVYSTTVSAETVTFYMEFVNSGPVDHYGILPPPTGFDGFLLDQTRRATRPMGVSTSFTSSIFPEGGLAPGEAQRGFVIFERPAGMSAGYFVFEGYELLYWEAEDAGGLAVGRQSLSGELITSEPMPSVNELAMIDVLSLLEMQADTLLNNDRVAHQALLSEAAGEATLSFFDSVATLPFQKVEMHYQPDGRDTRTAESGFMSRLDVKAEVQPLGYSATNSHILQLSYDVVKEQGHWVIEAIDITGDTPIWMWSDVVSLESEHFYIFASPDLADSLTEFATEFEAAYVLLVDKGLAVGDKTSVYYASSENEFRRLTGASSSGIASSITHYLSGDLTLTGSQIFMNNEKLLERSEFRMFVAAHELTHIVFAPDAREAMPIWLVEGIAEYFSDAPGRVTSETLHDVFSLDLERLTFTNEFQGSLINSGYAYSGLLVAYLVESYGEAELLNFYTAYSTLPVDETGRGMKQLLTETLLLEHFAIISLDQLDTDFKSWLATR